MKEKWDQILVEQCAPTLAGLKPASLFSCKAPAAQVLARWRPQLGALGLSLLLLHKNPRTGACLFYVFHRQWVWRNLQHRRSLALLGRAGYPPAHCLGPLLAQLRRRLGPGGDFPHEIGLFLGYPPGDVEGFIRHGGRHYACCGFWKVYEDPHAAQAQFARYQRVTQAFCQRFAQGMTICQLVAAG